jgi:cobalt-zinc-cadmium efflux system membrane fusion protein
MKSKSSYFWPYAILTGIALYSGGWLHSQYVGRVWPFTTLHTTFSTGLASNGIDLHGEAEHDEHESSGHAEFQSLALSESAQKNLGLSDEYLKPIELQDYQQVISVPAIVVDRPGRTRLPISAPMTGMVTHVHVASGEAVEPGDLILEMRLTHEDLVTAQKEYLHSLGDRDIELKEITRIEGIASSGAISTKTLLDRQYNRDKLDSLLRSQREALHLHGLSEAQISRIDSERRLLTEIRVYAPGPDTHSEEEIRMTLQNQHDFAEPDRNPSDSAPNSPRSNPFQVARFHEREHSPNLQSKDDASTSPRVKASIGKNLLVLQGLQAQKGQVVNAGETLCVLADYETLLAEGQAFEAEVSQIAAAKLEGWPISATLGTKGKPERIDNLQLSWLNNEIDAVTRTLKFYVTLKNELIEDDLSPTGQRHISWKYRVGQRMELGIPIAQWTDQIVLPVEAVVREGIDSFVFQQNGDRFNQIPVHEKYRDQTHVVIENDGALFPGDVVALRGAYQMQMALRNQSGGTVDPHAGHNH